MNGSPAVKRALEGIKRGDNVTKLLKTNGSVWLHTALYDNLKLQKEMGINSADFLGAGKMGVAYEMKRSDRVVVATTHAQAAERMKSLRSAAVVRVHKALVKSVSNKHDSRRKNVAFLTMERLSPITKGEEKILKAHCYYYWSFPRLAEKHGSERALARLLEHIALVEYEAPKPPRIVREVMSLVRTLYDQGYWHRNLHFGNVMRDAKGSLKMVDVGEILPLKGFDFSGRVDPYRGVYASSLGSKVRVANRMQHLKRIGWDPLTARKKLKKIKQRVRVSLKAA